MTDPSRPATGYPAPPSQPPPHHQPNNYYYPNHNPYNYNAPTGYYQPPPRATFFRRFFAALIAVFIIFGVILLIVWLVLRPRIPDFTVNSVTVSSLNVSTSPPPQISGTWSLRFSVVNPNSKLHVYYDEVEARLYYRGGFISLNELPPFDQATKNQTEMDATIVASNVYVNSDLANRIREDRSKGNVLFDVRLVAIVRFKAGGWRARRRFLRVFCDDLSVEFSNSSSSSSRGTLRGGPKRCAVGI